MIFDKVGEYVDQARIVLQDNLAPYRYSDGELIASLNMAVLDGLRIRPDLFYGATIDGFVSKDDPAGMIAPGYRPAFLSYVVGYAEMRDAEPASEARGTAFLTAFTRKLLTPGA